MNFLLYYSRFAFNNLLPTAVMKHFELLSAATFVLCRSNITLSELNQACTMLIKFTDDFEKIYGPGSITMNIHLLRHYENMIRNCGPIWANSLFGFEAKIGEVKQLVSGKTDVLVQISEKYIAKQLIMQNVDTEEEKITRLCQIKTIKLTERIKTILSSHGINLPVKDDMCIARRLKMKGVTYTSMLSSETKSADFFLEMCDGSLGIAEFYFNMNDTFFVLLNNYKINCVHYHLREVENIKSARIIKCRDIKRKVLYLKCAGIEYVSDYSQNYGFMR